MIAVILMLMSIPATPAPKPELPARPTTLRVIMTHRFPGVAVCEATQVKRFGIWTTIRERCRTEVVPKDMTIK